MKAFLKREREEPDKLDKPDKPDKPETKTKWTLILFFFVALTSLFKGHNSCLRSPCL